MNFDSTVKDVSGGVHYQSKVKSVRFKKKVSYVHQGCIYLIKNTAKTVIL